MYTESGGMPLWHFLGMRLLMRVTSPSQFLLSVLVKPLRLHGQPSSTVSLQDDHRSVVLSFAIYHTKIITLKTRCNKKMCNWKKPSLLLG